MTNTIQIFGAVVIAVVLLTLSFIPFVFMAREEATQEELIKFFSGCHAINKDTIQCHVPEEWDVIKERK